MKYDNSQENVAINDTDHNDRRNDIEGFLVPVTPVEKLHQVRATGSRSKSTVSIPDNLQQGTSQCHKNEISIVEISPIPIGPEKTVNGQSHKQHSDILTSTPMKLNLIEKEEKKNAKVEKSQARSKKRQQFLRAKRVCPKKERL
ncbi:hypothetical protein JTB14_010509 [Gonioctena quinquepunctata]|nr:hypothetical protein JTB14_010509 [Gonioctena quinquepunctata]